VTRGRGGPCAPAAIFVFAPDRNGERPAAHLENFSGILHVDGYAGFARLQAPASPAMVDGYPVNRLYELPPWNWKPPEAVKS
jgi:hypothetical protein